MVKVINAIIIELINVFQIFRLVMFLNTLLNTQMKGIKIAFLTQPVSRSYDFRFL